jgi:hypothetical protein
VVIATQAQQGENLRALRRSLPDASKSALRRRPTSSRPIECVPLTGPNAIVTLTTDYDELAVAALRSAGRLAYPVV